MGKMEISNATDISFVGLLHMAKEAWRGNKREVHAIELLKYYLEFMPGRAKAWMLYGDSLRIVGRSDEAYAALSKAHAICQQRDNEGIGIIAERMALLVEKYKSPYDAKEWYEIATHAFGPNVGWTWVMCGRNLVTLGEFERAIDCFLTVICTQADEEAEALFNLGLTYRALGKYDDAIICIRQALDINGSYEEAQDVLSGLEGIHETIIFIQKSRHDELSLDGIYNRAEEAWNKKEHEAHVVELLRHYLFFCPGTAKIWFMYGDSLGVLGNINEALSALNQALERCHEREWKGQIAMKIAMLTEKHISPFEAKEWYEMANHELGSVTSSDISFLWGLRGANLAVLGEFDQAIECYQTVAEMHDDLEDEALLNLGLVYRAMAKYDEAIDCFRQALVINPTYKEAQDVLHGLEGIHDTLELIEKHKQQK